MTQTQIPCTEQNKQREIYVMRRMQHGRVRLENYKSCKKYKGTSKA